MAVDTPGRCARFSCRTLVVAPASTRTGTPPPGLARRTTPVVGRVDLDDAPPLRVWPSLHGLHVRAGGLRPCRLEPAHARRRPRSKPLVHGLRPLAPDRRAWTTSTCGWCSPAPPGWASRRRTRGWTGPGVATDVRVDARVDGHAASTAAPARRHRQPARGEQQPVADVALAHVVPRYRAPRWVAAPGWRRTRTPICVDVDSATLRHRRFHDDLVPRRRRRPADPAVRRSPAPAGRRPGPQPRSPPAGAARSRTTTATPSCPSPPPATA